MMREDQFKPGAAGNGPEAAVPKGALDYPARALAVASDMEARRRRLEIWLGERLAPSGRVTIPALTPPAGNGTSSETYLFEAQIEGAEGALSRPFVARFEPERVGVYPEYDIPRQFDMLRALRDHTDLPVATVLWLETDRDVAGAPFYVMDRLKGRAPSDFPPIHMGGWFHEAPPGEQRRLWLSGIEAMAKVHAVDWRTPGLEIFDRPAFGAAGVRQQLGYLRHFFAWAAQGERYDIISRALEWLDGHAPASAPVHLLWGDSRFGNVFFRSDGGITLLDWEMSWLGDPACDVAWWLCGDYAGSTGAGLPRLASLPTHAETVAHYERVTGRTLSNLGYNLVLAAAVGAVTMIRIAYLISGEAPAGRSLAQDNAMSRLLDALLEADGEIRTPLA